MKVKNWIPLLIACAFATLLFAGVALAAATVQVVTEGDVARQPENTPPTNDWVIYTRLGGNATFVVGPPTPPLGVGSLQFNTPTGADKVFAFNYDHVNTPLTAINEIRYATYRTAGALQQVASLNIQVDYNGADPGGFTTLVFEPVYNTTQGAVVSNVWQNWDAYNGGNAIWWSTQPIAGVCAFNCFVPWSTIVASNPNAVILGGFGVNQGSGNPALTTAVDALTLGYAGNSVTYNFEPYRVATTVDDCKNGGWQNVKRADGSSFKNQGDCIQYVNTGK